MFEDGLTKKKTKCGEAWARIRDVNHKKNNLLNIFMYPPSLFFF